MRMADGKGIEEVVLVALDRKKDRRELDMGPPAPKPELKADTIRPVRFTRSRSRFVSTYAGDPRQRRVYVFSDWYRRTSQGKLWQGIRFRHGTSRRGKEALAVPALPLRPDSGHINLTAYASLHQAKGPIRAQGSACKRRDGSRVPGRRWSDETAGRHQDPAGHDGHHGTSALPEGVRSSRVDDSPQHHRDL